ncbi:MAG TPA: hypothetical protein VMT45_10170 [Thermoanaerobaculaceae bacterium]|nr:hypothetical protein [Thermoanaerobaculaceae bacterium]
MSRRASLLLCGLCLALTGAATVSARVRQAPVRVRLDYRRLAGAERCPTQHELEAQVSEILGRRPFVRKAKRTVRCVLQGEGDGIAARVQLLDTRSGRVLGLRELSSTGAGCEELGSAVALAIALAIDPLAKPPASRPPPATASATAVPVGPARPPAAPSTAGPSTVASTSTPGATSTAPRTGRPERPGLLQDAGPLISLGLVPLALSSGPDGGGPVGVPDAGLLDAGTPAPDAGPGAPHAGLAALAVVDAGPPDLSVVDAGLPEAAVETGVGEAAPPTPSRTGWRPVGGVGAVGAAGVLPGFAGGVLVHAGAASSTASVELEGRWLPGTTLAYGTGTISTSLVSGALVGCARFGSWAACGLTQAGPLSAKGQGYSRSQEASAWMVSVGARGQWEWLFADPLGLRLHIDGAVNVVRPRFLVDSQEAWAVPPVSVWVGGGLFGRF